MTMKGIISQFTNIGQIALPAGAGLYSLYKKDYKGVAWLLLSLVINQVGIEVLKVLFNTIRPNGRSRSFPSGHTAAAFLGPCFMMSRYKLSLRDPLVFFSMIAATLVGIGRVLVKAHWPVDILGGAFLGYTVTWLVPSLD